VENALPQGKVKSTHDASGPSGRHLSRVFEDEATRSIIYSPLDGILVHRRVTPSIKIRPYLFVYLSEERHCFARKHTQCPRPGLGHSETRALTMRPSRLHKRSHIIIMLKGSYAPAEEFMSVSTNRRQFKTVPFNAYSLIKSKLRGNPNALR